jgi:hypothetical protein
MKTDRVYTIAQHGGGGAVSDYSKNRALTSELASGIEFTLRLHGDYSEVLG